MTTWLQIGPGNKPRRCVDAVMLDIRAGVGDVTGDVRRLPYPDGLFDGVECSHVLEHLERDEAPGAMRECYRVLRRGGVLEVATPDMEAIAHSLIAGNRQVMVNVYSPDPEPEQRHRWGYTPTTLRELIEAAGFCYVEELPRTEPHEVRYQARKV